MFKHLDGSGSWTIPAKLVSRVGSLASPNLSAKPAVALSNLRCIPVLGYFAPLKSLPVCHARHEAGFPSRVLKLLGQALPTCDVAALGAIGGLKFTSIAHLAVLP